MKISTTKDNLLKPLLLANNIVERRQTLPILANILMKVENQRLFVTATDLEVELSTNIAITTDEDTSFTLPARKLVDICKALPDESNIELNVEDTRATLIVGRGKYSMGVLPAEDYPSIEASATTDTLHIPQSSLKRLIDKTAFAMAQQDVRYYLNGLLLEINSGEVRTVATDGHRLALCDSALEVEGNIDRQIILPRKAVIELARLLADGDSVAKVEMNNNFIRITVGDSSFTSKLIDGRFPEYERVMPTEQTYQMVADKQMLKQALVRTSVLSNEKYRGIRFSLDKNLLYLQAHNPEQDEAKEELEVDYAGDKISIGFNVSYLLDVLNVIETEQIHMALVNADSSCLITASDSSDCRYIVMPMRL